MPSSNGGRSRRTMPPTQTASKKWYSSPSALGGPCGQVRRGGVRARAPLRRRRGRGHRGREHARGGPGRGVTDYSGRFSAVARSDAGVLATRLEVCEPDKCPAGIGAVHTISRGACAALRGNERRPGAGSEVAVDHEAGAVTTIQVLLQRADALARVALPELAIPAGLPGGPERRPKRHLARRRSGAGCIAGRRCRVAGRRGQRRARNAERGGGDDAESS